MSTIKMQRVVDGRLQVRNMPAHLATSHAAKMGGWIPVQTIAVPVPEIAPVQTETLPPKEPTERPAVAVVSAEEQPAPKKRVRPRITKTPDDASNA